MFSCDPNSTKLMRLLPPSKLVPFNNLSHVFKVCPIISSTGESLTAISTACKPIVPAEEVCIHRGYMLRGRRHDLVALVFVLCVLRFKHLSVHCSTTYIQCLRISIKATFGSFSCRPRLKSIVFFIQGL